ncbi:hypothetical protein [Pedomonas sp. V897]|uniref:hypothetical protein n=1 Tax=Pedomonas sp. V897 TaxID=3446482 RepID=UPI003EDED3B4
MEMVPHPLTTGRLRRMTAAVLAPTLLAGGLLAGGVLAACRQDPTPDPLPGPMTNQTTGQTTDQTTSQTGQPARPDGPDQTVPTPGNPPPSG